MLLDDALRHSMKRLGILLTVLAAACGADEPSAQDAIDVCETAARHIESCTGEYLTPPRCDAAAAAQAEELLAESCGQLAARTTARAADGALCDWFGANCAPDEDIFHGAACASDATCGDGFCVEGHCFAGVGSAEMDGILADLTGSDVVGGNRTRVLVDNRETVELWRSLIDSAQESINIVSLIIENNPIGLDLADRLEAAARRGVDVRVLIDSVSELSYGKYSILTDLAAAGAHVLAFNPIPEYAVLRYQVDLWANERLHEKVLVVDGRHGIVGGRNMGDSYMADGRWRDTDVYIEGPAVAELQRLVLGSWDESAGWERLAGCPQRVTARLTCPTDDDLSRADEPVYFPSPLVLGGDDVRVIHSNPRTQSPSDGYQTYLSLIRGARRSIRITNAYFTPPQRLRRHLKAAVARGVDVTIITNSKASVDEDVMWYAAANFYEELTRAGVKIVEWQGTETNHAKTMLVDDQVAVIASYNLDPRSATSNSESLAVLRGAAVRELLAAWQVDITRTAPAPTSFGWAEWLLIRAHRIAEPLL
jgi:cardiolipin synthase